MKLNDETVQSIRIEKDASGKFRVILKTETQTVTIRFERETNNDAFEDLLDMFGLEMSHYAA